MAWRSPTQQNKNFGNLTFAQDADGNWGYKVGGAGSVIPFKSLDIVYVGAITSSGSINVMSKCPNYKKMTAGDFLLDYQSMTVRSVDLQLTYQNTMIRQLEYCLCLICQRLQVHRMSGVQLVFMQK